MADTPVSPHELVTLIRRLARAIEPEATAMAPRREPLPGIRAVLFDVYGTLFISASGDVGTLLGDDRAGPLADALADAGLQGRLSEAAAKGVRLFHDAITDTHAALRARGVRHPEIDAHRLWTGVLEALAKGALIRGPILPIHVATVAVSYEMRVNPVWPMPDARSLLRLLSERRYPMGIVSNAQFYTPLLFDALLGGPLASLGFDPDLCAWSSTAGEAKPSQGLFAPVLRALQAGGIAAREVIYVGNDMLNDMATSAAAGCRTVLFAGDRRSLRLREGDPRCTEVHPDRVITRLGELARVLGLLTDR